MSGKRKSQMSGLWLGFGLAIGAAVGLFLDPSAILFFAAVGIIVAVVVMSAVLGRD
jgi:hypothetical protein